MLSSNVFTWKYKSIRNGTYEQYNKPSKCKKPLSYNWILKCIPSVFEPKTIPLQMCSHLCPCLMLPLHALISGPQHHTKTQPSNINLCIPRGQNFPRGLVFALRSRAHQEQLGPPLQVYSFFFFCPFSLPVCQSALSHNPCDSNQSESKSSQVVIVYYSTYGEYITRLSLLIANV